MYSIPQREDGTLGKVLGKDNPYGGMRREDFFDEIQVKIVYTSLYACTSFVTGQAMNAFFRGSDPPVPASAGLGFSAAFSVSECGTPIFRLRLRFSLGHCALISEYETDDSIEENWVEIYLLRVDLDERTPVTTTFPLLSPVSPSGAFITAPNLLFTSSSSLDSLETGDTSMSSSAPNESLGPCTPVKPLAQYPRVALHAAIFFPTSSSQEILSVQPLKAMPKNDVGGGSRPWIWPRKGEYPALAS
uniref:Uncharacterized protein n=1 Tax=Moniliophthora roreri TaxID=221103 RepID=A0A0W0FWX7_MONRR